jgi:hypothetical protein
MGVLAGALSFLAASAGPVLTKKAKRSPVGPPPAGSVGVTVQVLPSIPVPGRFHLLQNYPNPFNSSTVISYSTLTGAAVSLKIYNILGQEVATLVSGQQPAGQHAVVEHHEVVWNAVDREGKSLPSGIYLCQMIAGNRVETRKLVLLR